MPLINWENRPDLISGYSEEYPKPTDYPTNDAARAAFYSIATVLLTMLIGSGIGSRVAEQFSNKMVFGMIVVLLVALILIFKPVIALFTELPVFRKEKSWS